MRTRCRPGRVTSAAHNSSRVKTRPPAGRNVSSRVKTRPPVAQRPDPLCARPPWPRPANPEPPPSQPRDLKRDEAVWPTPYVRYSISPGFVGRLPPPFTIKNLVSVSDVDDLLM